MKRLMLATMVAVALGSSSGCCLFDRLFGCPRGYPMPGAGGCGGCGGCNSCAPCNGCYQGGGCPTGGCPTCNDGTQGCPTCGPSGCGPNGYGPMGDPNDYGACNDGSQSPFRCAGLRQQVPGGPPGLCPWGYRRYAGPQTGQVVYPYYTTRGPRDFLNPNPPSIGP